MKNYLPAIALSLMVLASQGVQAADLTAKTGLNMEAAQTKTEINGETKAQADDTMPTDQSQAKSTDSAQPPSSAGVTEKNQASATPAKGPSKTLTQLFQSFKKEPTAQAGASTPANTKPVPPATTGEPTPNP
jgi:hypothetical protein